MRLATTISVALIALSSAALAQVATPTVPASTNNIMADGAATPGDAADVETATALDGVDNMLSQSAAPPPAEPK